MVFHLINEMNEGRVKEITSKRILYTTFILYPNREPTVSNLGHRLVQIVFDKVLKNIYTQRTNTCVNRNKKICLPPFTIPPRH